MADAGADALNAAGTGLSEGVWAASGRIAALIMAKHKKADRRRKAQITAPGIDLGG